MKTKRIIALAATLLMGATTMSAFSGCGEKDSDYDPTKANLSVATYDGGVGGDWLKDAAQRFMDLHANSTHFQEGRTGVKISVDADKTKYSGTNLADKALNKDMYFTEGVEYYTFVNRDKVADITDVVTGSMATYGETGTIEEKLDSSFQDFLTAKDDKYYMLPFYSGFYGFIYDIDLFEEEGFYFDAEGDFVKLEMEGDKATEEERAAFEAKKSNGPDGKKGNYDDGLPATYEQFIELAIQIKSKGYTPFCYSGNYSDYVDKAFRSFIADYEGYDAFKLNYTFDGENVEVVKSINADGSVELETIDKITQDNGYELQRQAGKYYAFKMQEELLGSVEFVGGSWNAFDYTVAQSEFINSKYSTDPSKPRYAMLMEGVWWENEAEAAFTAIETVRGEKKSDRHFGFLPMPKVSEDKAGPQTMFSANSSFGFINKNVENMELAKEFMRFLHTDAEMSKFSAKTSIPRSLNYKVSEADRATATSFGKSLIDMVAEAKVVYPYSSLSLVINNSSAFTETAWFLTTSVNGKPLNSPFSAFTASTGKVSAKTYFEGLYTYQQSVWPTLQR